jgi:CHAT domain-containing protein
VLSDEHASVQPVLDGMVEADLVHIAAHGGFRADSPLFSALRLADGPLIVHDLQWLRSTPAMIVLTACSAARNGVLAGDELLGTSTALLSLGVRTVVAPMLPVPDSATAQFSTDLHHALVGGNSPPVALAIAARLAFDRGDDGSVATAVSFQCMGTRSARFPVSAARRATL